MNYIIQNLFKYTVQILFYLVNILHIPYKTLNIVIWYIILPSFWLYIIDHSLCFCYMLLWLIIQTSTKGIIINNKLFYKSQQFILCFGEYTKWSVIVCLLVPILFTLLLIYAKFLLN